MLRAKYTSSFPQFTIKAQKITCNIIKNVARSMAQAVKHLPGKHEAMYSNPNTTKITTKKFCAIHASSSSIFVVNV
jgi:hypothetical protein